MKTDSTIHPEALTDTSRQLFPHLAFDEFYLAGGTALALQIGHRQSVDLDFFQMEEMPNNLLSRVTRRFSNRTIIPSINNLEELSVYIDKVKVTFITYPFPLQDTLIKTENLTLASVPELAAMKAYTISSLPKNTARSRTSYPELTTNTVISLTIASSSSNL